MEIAKIIIFNKSLTNGEKNAKNSVFLISDHPWAMPGQDKPGGRKSFLLETQSHCPLNFLVYFANNSILVCRKNSK